MDNHTESADRRVGSGRGRGHASVGRRRILAAVGTASLGSLAGCTGLTENEFAAAPVTMPAENAAAIGHREVVTDSHTVVEQDRTAGVGVDTTVTSHYAAYTEDGDGEDGGRGPLTVSGLSTPKADVLRAERNPLVGQSPRDLLSAEGMDWFLRPAGFGSVTRDWIRGGIGFTSDRAAVFGGTDARVSTRSGLIETGEELTVLVAHSTQYETEADVVSGFGVRQWPVNDADRPLLGPDGHLTNAEFAADVTSATAGLNALRHG